MSDSASRERRIPTPALRREIAGFLSGFASDDTRGTYERCLREFLRWYEASPSFRFTVEDIEHYKQYLAGTKQFSPVSVSTYLTSLRRLCAYLAARRVLPENPAASVPGTKCPRRHRRSHLSPEEVRRLLETLSEEDELSSRNSAIVRLMIDCGLTTKEIVQLNVDDYRGIPLCRFLCVRGRKRTTEARVELPLASERALDRYLAWRKRHQGEPLTQPLFVSLTPHRLGKRISRRCVRGVVASYLIRAGIKRSNITPLSLRRTAAQRMAEAGATPEEIRQRLRLGSMQTTFVYLH